MSQVNANIEIQKYLKDNEWYDGPLDGKFGPATVEGINKLLEDRGLPSNWPKARKLIAAEQILYKTQNIEIGKIDGLVGPQTEYARKVYEAKLVTTWRDKLDEITPAPVKPVTEFSIKPVQVIDKPAIWPRQSDCTSFYGKVGTNQVTCQVPFEMVLAWDTKTKLTSYSCHKKVKEPMERIWQRTLDHYGYDKIKELRLHYFGGCLNVRKMRGGSSWSQHAYGIAVDIDPDRNSLHTTWKNAQMSKAPYKKFVEFWYDEGAINLGVERDFDPMHYQFSRL